MTEYSPAKTVSSQFDGYFSGIEHDRLALYCIAALKF